MKQYIERTACALRAILVIFIVINFIGCGTEPAEEYDPSISPPQLEVTASSNSIFQSESVTLSWQSNNADKLTLIPGDILLEESGSAQYTPVESTKYTITATNENGNTVQSVEVDVIIDTSAPSSPKIISVQAFGRSVILSWHPSTDDFTNSNDILYRIYYSDNGPSLNVGQLNYLGETVGLTEFSADQLPSSSRLYFYVIAVDSIGNESNLSEEGAIKIGSVEPVLRSDLTLIDLEEIGADYTKLNPTTLIINSYSSISAFKVNDIVISYDGDDSFVGKVLETNIDDSTMEISIEPMGVFDLFSDGEFNLTIKGGAEYKPDKFSDSFKTKVGPLDITTNMNFKPDVEVSFELGSSNVFTAKLTGDWSADITAAIAGSGSYSLEKEFTIDSLTFETKYRSKVKAKKAYTFMVNIKTQVTGVASIEASGEFDLTTKIKALGSIDESFHYEGALTSESNSSVPSIEVIPSMKAAGNVQASISLRPQAEITTVQGLLYVKERLEQTYNVSMGVEDVPDRDIVNLEYPANLVQLSNLDLR